MEQDLSPRRMPEEAQDQAWAEGRRSAHRDILRQSLRALGFDLTNQDVMLAQVSAMLIEREEAVAQLREICAAFGDNNWARELNLADILDKHLARHLFQRKKDEQ
jgi:hypothetical protein